MLSKIGFLVKGEVGICLGPNSAREFIPLFEILVDILFIGIESSRERCVRALLAAYRLRTENFPESLPVVVARVIVLDVPVVHYLHE